MLDSCSCVFSDILRFAGEKQNKDPPRGRRPPVEDPGSKTTKPNLWLRHI